MKLARLFLAYGANTSNMPNLIWPWKQGRVRPAYYLDGRKVVPSLTEYEDAERRETLMQPSWDRQEPVKSEWTGPRGVLVISAESQQKTSENPPSIISWLQKALFISPLEKKNIQGPESFCDVYSALSWSPSPKSPFSSAKKAKHFPPSYCKPAPNSGHLHTPAQRSVRANLPQVLHSQWLHAGRFWNHPWWDYLPHGNWPTLSSSSLNGSSLPLRTIL